MDRPLDDYASSRHGRHTRASRHGLIGPSHDVALVQVGNLTFFVAELGEDLAGVLADQATRTRPSGGLGEGDDRPVAVMRTEQRVLHRSVKPLSTMVGSLMVNSENAFVLTATHATSWAGEALPTPRRRARRGSTRWRRQVCGVCFSGFRAREPRVAPKRFRDSDRLERESSSSQSPARGAARKTHPVFAG